VKVIHSELDNLTASRKNFVYKAYPNGHSLYDNIRTHKTNNHFLQLDVTFESCVEWLQFLIIMNANKNAY